MTATERAPGQQVQRTDVDAAFRGSATYRSLGEQELSPAEERFEKGRRTVGLFLAPAVTIVFALLPIDLPRDQHLLAAILLGVIVLWITEPVPIPIGGLIGVCGDRHPRRRPVGRRPGAVRLDDDLHLHRRVHPRHGHAQARPGPAVRDVRALAEVGRRVDVPGDHRLRRRSPACCRRSSPTPRPSRCCCRRRSASSR